MIELILFLVVFVVGVCVGVILHEAQTLYETKPLHHHGAMGHPGLSRLFALREAETRPVLRRLSLREYAQAIGRYEEFYT